MQPISHQKEKIHPGKHLSSQTQSGSIRFWITGCVLIGIIVLIALGVATWLCPAPFLTTMVNLWAVSDKVAPADAVAVLGGSAETRPVAAADYYRRGLVKTILLSNIRPEEVHSETRLNHDVLVQLGVPESAIELIGDNLSSTYDEAIALRKWALSHHARRLIVPSEYFSSRRVRWVMRHELIGTGTQVLVPAFDYPQYHRNEWWKDARAVTLFKVEFLKYLYYLARY